MVPPACTITHWRICLRLVFGLLFSLSFAVTALSQTATYHIHKEASTTANLLQLKTTGPAVVGTEASKGVTFTVAEVGAIGGTITRTSDGSFINGALIEVLQGGVVKRSTTSAANGTYEVANVEVGTYDVRVSAPGYQTRTKNGEVVTANTTTTVNQNLDEVAIDYIYDELGRLVAVITPAEVVTYSYDAVGNLLSISSGNSSQVSIIEFTPNSGSIGDPGRREVPGACRTHR